MSLHTFTLLMMIRNALWTMRLLYSLKLFLYINVMDCLASCVIEELAQAQCTVYCFFANISTGNRIFINNKKHFYKIKTSCKDFYGHIINTSTYTPTSRLRTFIVLIPKFGQDYLSYRLKQ